MSQNPQDPAGAYGHYPTPSQDRSRSHDPYATPAPGGPGAAAPWQAGAPSPAPAPYQKSTAATVFGILLLLLAGLFTLGTLANLATGGGPSGGGAAYALGFLIGGLLMIALPAALGIFLLTLNGRRRKRAEAQQYQGYPGYQGYQQNPGHPSS